MKSRDTQSFEPARRALVLALAGFNLSLIQFVMVRELTAILRGVEAVILLVTVCFFAGFSLGYFVAERLRESWLAPLGAFTLGLHLGLPLLYRYGSGWLAGADLRSAVFVGGLALSPLVVSAFYSVFLPRYAGEGSLVSAYVAELTGAALGIVALVLLGGVGVTALLIVYALALLIVLALLGTRRVVLGALAMGAVLYLLAYPRLDAHSNAYLYRHVRGLEGARSLAVRYSPYQRVDVIEAEGWRKLYLDGQIHFGNQSLGFFNVYVAHLPALLVEPERALIVGSGSMASVGYVAPYAGQVTTVELDPQVVAISREFYADVNRLDEIPNWTLVLADGKQFLATSETEYDLIVMDVTVPLTIQTAMLHSVEFYQLARRRLTPTGVLAISLNGRFRPGNPTPLAVAAAAAQAFDHFYILTPALTGRSFLYASPTPSFEAAALTAQLAGWGDEDYELYTADEARAVIGQTPPIRLDDLQLVWVRSWRAVRRWWFGG